MNLPFEQLILRAEQLIDRLEAVLPRALSAPDWTAAVAWRYRKRSAGHGVLEPVRHLGPMRLADLKEIDPQKEKTRYGTNRNTSCSPTSCLQHNKLFILNKII